VDLTHIWTPRNTGDHDQPPQPEAAPALRAALAELERLVSVRPDLEPLWPAITSLLKETFADPGSPDPSLRPDDENTPFLINRIKEGWAQGMPAARVVPLALDPMRLWKRAIALIACTDSENLSAKRLRELIGDDPARVGQLVQKALADEEDTSAALPEATDLDVSFATSILRLTLLSELGDWSARICEHFSEATWPRGDCPVCGALPALGESRGLEQRRILRCGRCGAGWPGNRLHCPFCCEGDHHALRVLSAEEDQGKYHLFLCDSCGGQLKVITTLSALSPPGLIVAEFAMLHLDLLESQETA
jgi:FdhE protein